MKQLLFFFLLISISTNSQEFTKVDDLVSHYPRFSKAEDLANQISKDFSTDKNKARAAFFWLAKNIRYNLRKYNNPTKRSYNFRYTTEQEKQQKLQAFKDKIIAKAFITKTGVCEEYAQSFKKMCDLLHIEAAVITGNTRNSPAEIGKLQNTANHAWNAVKLNNKWMLLDVTWAAGYEMDGKWVRKFNNYFYNIPKSKIFKTHLPEDTIWILRFGRITKKEFFNQPIYGNVFLNSKATLISPKGGIINVNSSKEIQLKFRNLDVNSIISYTFKGMRYTQKPIITREKSTTTLTIKNAQINSELVLYFNRKAGLQFKTK
jgi:transglutaminase/protease-like cytokinesis protein 3